MIGQGYDGAAAKSGNFKGVQMSINCNLFKAIEHIETIINELISRKYR